MTNIVRRYKPCDSCEQTYQRSKSSTDEVKMMLTRKISQKKSHKHDAGCSDSGSRNSECGDETPKNKGSKDGLCSLEQLEAVRKKMYAITSALLHVIEGGDHSFKMGKKHLQSCGSNKKEAEDHAVLAIRKFVSSFLGMAMDKYLGHPLALAEKSMGSRVSSMVDAEKDIAASAVVPLKGSKDGLCPIEQLEAVKKKMNAITSALHVIEVGDHSFKIGKKHVQSRGSNQEAAEERHHAVLAIRKFVSSFVGGEATCA